jgi:hypothetical protein
MRSLTIKFINTAIKAAAFISLFLSAWAYIIMKFGKITFFLNPKCPMKKGTMTFSIISISNMPFGIKRLSIMTFSITIKHDTQHKAECHVLIVMLDVTMLCRLSTNQHKNIQHDNITRYLCWLSINETRHTGT